MKQQFIGFLARHTSTRFLLQKQRRLRNIPHLIINIKRDIASSHVPPQERKSLLRILLERIYLNWRYGYLGYIFYFSMKLDRRGERLFDHVTEGEFMLVRNYVNANYPSQATAYPGVTRDKVLCKHALSAMGGRVACCCAHAVIADDSHQGKIHLVDDFGHSVPWPTLYGKSIFFKPIFSQCGQGVMKFTVVNENEVAYEGALITISELERMMGHAVAQYGSAMMEECIIQHEAMARLNPSSVNTIRIMTSHSADGVKLFGCVCRIGAAGSPNDNYSTGGIIVGVDDSGRLLRHGYRKPEYGDSELQGHPGTGIVFEGYQIPYYEEAVKLCMNMQKRLTGVYSIGWDIAIDKEGPIIVECNDNWELELGEICLGRGFRKDFEETFVRTAKLLKKSSAMC